MQSHEIHSKTKPLERVMIFIDGGYIRKLFLDLFNDDKIDYEKIIKDMLDWYEASPPYIHRPNLIRTYYYDGIVDPKVDSEVHAKQREYFENLERQNENFSLNLGEAIKETNGRFRQKGVDVLLTIEALSMAFLDHYETGLFLLGDRDFIPLIEAVKSTGKRAFCFHYTKNVARELVVSFDVRWSFNEKHMEEWRKKGEFCKKTSGDVSSV